MVRTNPTLRSLAVLAALLVVCCAGTAFLRANLGRPVAPEGRMPGARVVWDKPAPHIRSVSFSASGHYVCTVSRGGLIDCYDSSGALRFSASVPGVDSAVVAPDGRCTMAYSQMNRANTRVTFIDQNGQVQWQMRLPGAIWCAEAGSRGDEACFAVGTGARHVYLIGIDRSSKRYRRWKTPGAVCSISMSSDCEKVIYGTWQRSSVSCSDATGHKHWQLEADPASLHHVRALGKSERLFLCATPNRWNGDGQAWLADEEGRLGIELPLLFGEKTKAMPSPDGSYICTGYTRSILHSGKSTPEKHAALYDRDGRKLWDKGSLLMPIAPLLVMPGGFVLASGAGNAILAVSPSGEVRQVCKTPSPVVGSFQSRDGLCALLLCDDGKMRMLRAIP